MSANKRPRKRYRPRPAAVNNLELALSHAAKRAAADRAQVLARLHQSVQALCSGNGSELDWSISAGAVNVAKAIERQGIVRGLAAHFASIEATLQAIYNRCMRTSMWLRPTLTAQEEQAITLLHELHSFQINQLSRAELLAAIDQAQKQTRADGHVATVVRDLESLPA